MFHPITKERFDSLPFREDEKNYVDQGLYRSHSHQNCILVYTGDKDSFNWTLFEARFIEGDNNVAG